MANSGEWLVGDTGLRFNAHLAQDFRDARRF